MTRVMLDSRHHSAMVRLSLPYVVYKPMTSFVHSPSRSFLSVSVVLPVQVLITYLVLLVIEPCYLAIL